MRQISLDTETTGLLYSDGHRIIEIGCIEIINRQITGRTFHRYINPRRKIDIMAKKITGITDSKLENKPFFEEIVGSFFNFLNNSNEILAHNADFDINFINNELKLMNYETKNIKNMYKFLDTLVLARQIHPGKKNSLDALCERYNINTEERKTHGALLDAKLLAKVYIEMTSQQSNITFRKEDKVGYKNIHKNELKALNINKQNIKEHVKHLNALKKHMKN